MQVERTSADLLVDKLPDGSKVIVDPKREAVFVRNGRHHRPAARRVLNHGRTASARSNCRVGWRNHCCSHHTRANYPIAPAH